MGLGSSLASLADGTLSRPFEGLKSHIDQEWIQLLCPACAGEMVPIAVITQDAQLARLLAHLGWSAEFPKTKPARAPPAGNCGEDSQLDSAVDAWDGRDPPADE